MIAVAHYSVLDQLFWVMFSMSPTREVLYCSTAHKLRRKYSHYKSIQLRALRQ